MDRNSKTGFTLIELSIVLVIIGLIAGGVMVGQNLIEAAKLRSTISDKEKLDLAVRAFQTNYDCLPGDCPDATTFFSAATQPDKVTNGDGDRTISGFAGEPWKTEQGKFNDHLAAAGLISLQTFDETSLAQAGIVGIGYPKTEIGTGLLIGTGDVNGSMFAGQRSYLLGGSSGESDAWVQTDPSTLLPRQAMIIDQKIDDGQPMSGKVRAGGNFADGDDVIFGYPATPAASGACVSNAAGNPYAVNEEEQLCNLHIRTGW